jgi:putative iron-dependent peroxidase
LTSQPYILSKPLECGLSLTLALASGADAARALKSLAKGFDTRLGTLAIGEPLVRALRKKVPGLSTFPAMSAPGCGVPSTQQAAWLMLQGATQGKIVANLQKLEAFLQPGFVVVDSLPTFHNASHDLTGYEDGTENPKGTKAVKAAIVSAGTGLSGSSFVSVQRWVHDLDHSTACRRRGVTTPSAAAATPTKKSRPRPRAHTSSARRRRISSPTAS